MKTSFSNLFLGLLIAIWMPCGAYGQIFNVSDAAGLQSALNAARTNVQDDQIRLAMGTYLLPGTLTYGTDSNNNRTIILSGGWYSNFSFQFENAPETTILDGSGALPILQILANAVGVEIVFEIENLTFQNGYIDSGYSGGSAILAYSGGAGQGSIQLTVRDCLFQNNNAAINRSGAIFSNCTLEIYNTRFLSNRAYNGGALFISYDNDQGASSSPLIDHCYFEDNYNYGNQGSTIWTNCAVRIKNSTFKGRSDGVSNSGPGSCIWGNDGSHLKIANSTFTGIRIKYWGPAIQAFNGAMDIVNCLFANNEAGVTTNNGYGTIAYYHNNNSTGQKTLNITHCTFVGNKDVTSYSGAIHNRGATVNVNNCILWDNGGNVDVYNESGTTTMRYSLHGSGGVGYGVTDGGGNLYFNPMFIDDDIYRLSADSQCVDRGSNDLVPADFCDVDNDGDTTEQLPLDVAGKSRFRDDPFTEDNGAGVSPVVDIGAYEFQLDKRFGVVNDKKNVKLILKNSDGFDVLFALTGNGFAAIDGSDPTFSNIELYWTDEKSQMTILSKAKDGTSVGDVLCFGPLKGISAKGIDFTGRIQIGQASLEYPEATFTFVCDQAEGLDLDCGMPIKSIAATEWWGSLKAPSVGSITTKLDKKRSLDGFLGIDMETGTVGTVNVAGQLDGTWECQSVKSITAAATDDFYLTLSQTPDPKIMALGKLTVKSDFDWSRIFAAGNIGVVTVGDFHCSTCFAGVDPSALHDSNDDGVYELPVAEAATFQQAATIKGIMVKGVKGDTECFSNSSIAAASIGSTSIVYPEYDNSGRPFGLCAGYIKTLKIKDSTTLYSGAKLDKPGDCAFTLSGDMQIRLD